LLDSVARTRQDLAALKRISAGQAGVDQATLDQVSAGLDKFMTIDGQIVDLYRRGDHDSLVKADDLVLKDEIAVFNTAAAGLGTVTDSITAELGRSAAKAAADGTTAPVGDGGPGRGRADRGDRRLAADRPLDPAAVGRPGRGLRQAGGGRLRLHRRHRPPG
jgi:hypothetical protein